MRPYHLIKVARLCLFSAAYLVCSQAGALSSDKDQPIEIAADSAELDDKKGLTVYEGNVVVTQGSIRMRGDKMTVLYNKDNTLDTVVLNGRPATYRQLPDKSEIYDEAEALQMEFYEAKNLIVLIDNAKVKQQEVTFSGDRIEYDTELSKIKARSLKSRQPAAEEDATVRDEGRVKITIQPRKKEQNK